MAGPLIAIAIVVGLSAMVVIPCAMIEARQQENGVAVAAWMEANHLEAAGVDAIRVGVLFEQKEPGHTLYAVELDPKLAPPSPLTDRVFIARAKEDAPVHDRQVRVVLQGKKLFIVPR